MVLENISFGYGEKRIFDQLNVQLKPSNIYGLIGPNGVGKTTLMSIIAGIFRNYQGKVHGMDSPGLLLQDIAFYHNLSGKENLRLFCLDRKIDPAKVDSALEMVDINPHMASQKFSVYSQGYKQRLGIARSFLTDGNLVLLDEPFTAVDVDTTRSLKSAILRFRDQTQKTIIISSHQLRQIEDILDACLLLKNQQLEEHDHRAAASQQKLIYLSLDQGTDSLQSLQQCEYVSAIIMAESIAEIQLRPNASLSQLLTWLEEKSISWNRLDRKMPLEFLYTQNIIR
ncbi:MAG: ABC transporter ATP-binding protein [Bacteroidota bacterium]